MDGADVVRHLHGRALLDSRVAARPEAIASTRSASNRAASGLPAERAPAAMAARRSGSVISAAISAGQALGRQRRLLVQLGAAGRRQARRHWPPGRGRAHGDRGPACAGRPITAISETVEAPERETTRWAAAMRSGHVAEERRHLGLDAHLGIGGLDGGLVVRARLLGDPQAARAAPPAASGWPAASSPRRSCAPWLPPNTSRWNGASAAGAAIGDLGRFQHRRPDRVAGQHGLVAERAGAGRRGSRRQSR